MSDRTFTSLDRIVTAGGEADDVLRSTVEALVRDPAVDWAGVAFLEDGVPTLGPSSGIPSEDARTHTPIVFGATTVGELWVDGSASSAFLERVASLIATYVLIGWDTGGEKWAP